MVGGWEKPKLIYLYNLPQDSNLGGKAKKKKRTAWNNLVKLLLAKHLFFVFLFWWLNFLVFHIQTFLYSTYILVSAIYSIVLNLLQFFFFLSELHHPYPKLLPNPQKWGVEGNVFCSFIFQSSCLEPLIKIHVMREKILLIFGWTG